MSSTLATTYMNKHIIRNCSTLRKLNPVLGYLLQAIRLLNWAWRRRDRRRRKSEIIHHLLLIHVIAAFVEHTPLMDIYLTMPFSPIMQAAEVFLGWKRV